MTLAQTAYKALLLHQVAKGALTPRKATTLYYAQVEKAL